MPTSRWEWRSGRPEQTGDGGVVHDSRWPDGADLADLGDFAEMHWQVMAPRSIGRRYPRARDCGYQVVVRLRPEDAQAVAVLNFSDSSD